VKLALRKRTGEPNVSDAPEPDLRPFTEVAVGLVHRRQAARPDHYEVLMGQRPAGKPYAGWWEFPGGKIESGESVANALARELQEELALQVDASLPWVVRTHSYPHARVRLHFRRIFAWSGEPIAMEQQAFAWQALDQITLTPLLPAALPLLDMLRWPARVVLLGFGASPVSYKSLEAQLLDARLRHGDRVMLKLDPVPTDGLPDLGNLLGAVKQAQEHGINIYLDEPWFNLVPTAQGVWHSTFVEGINCLQVSASDSFFEPGVDKAARSPRALIVLDPSAPPNQCKALAEAVELPLYWPDEAFSSFGGHGSIAYF
jgi:8-oxo-dGTP diphosphatase